MTEEETNSKAWIWWLVGTVVVVAALLWLIFGVIVPGANQDNNKKEDEASKTEVKQEEAKKEEPKAEEPASVSAAKETCGKDCATIAVVEYDWYTGAGTIWGMCDERHDGDEISACVTRTIADNQETITATAATYGLPGDGNYIFPGELLVIK
jgi:cytoskeletal protein RodZ